MKFASHGRLGRWTAAMATRHHGTSSETSVASPMDANTVEADDQSSGPETGQPKAMR